jgi:ABC-type sugar transport system substrate-binding protein
MEHRRRRRYLYALVAPALAVLLAACSSGQGAQVAAGAKSKTAGKKITFVTALLADANWAGANKCFMSRSKALGMVPTLVAPPNETASNSGMVQLAEQALASKPDGMIVVPLVPAEFDNVLDQAKAQKVPVIALDLDTSSPDQRIAWVTTDPKKYGVLAADEVGKLANGKGNVGILYSGPTVTNQLESMSTFKAELAQKFPAMKIVDPGEIIEPGGNRNEDNATEIARGMLVAHPNINVIWSPDGLGGIVGALAAKELNKKPGQIIIVGSDHLPQVAADLKSGWEQASLQSVSCAWGNALANTFAAYFNGKLKNPIVNIPPVLFTHDNP